MNQNTTPPFDPKPDWTFYLGMSIVCAGMLWLFYQLFLNLESAGI